MSASVAVGTASALLIGAVLAGAATRSVAGPLRHLTADARTLAEGPNSDDALSAAAIAPAQAAELETLRRGVATLVGKELDAIIGRTDLEFRDDPVRAATVIANDCRVMHSGMAGQIGERMKLPDGTPATWPLLKVPFRGPSGAVIGLIRDITDRKRAEELFRDSKSRLSDG